MSEQTTLAEIVCEALAIIREALEELPGAVTTDTTLGAEVLEPVDGWSACCRRWRIWTCRWPMRWAMSRLHSRRLGRNCNAALPRSVTRRRPMMMTS